jgi:hypothetical protein
MSGELERARMGHALSWRDTLGVPGEPTIRTFWFIVPQVFVFVLCRWMDTIYFAGYPFGEAAWWAAVALFLWVMACVAERSSRSWRLLAYREAEQLQLGAPELKPSIGLVTATWTGWLAVMLIGGMFAPRAVGMSVKCALACLCLSALARWPLKRIRRAREQRALLRSLAARLEREGVHRLEAGDPNRVAIAQRFWREQQERAAHALQRFEHAPLQPLQFDGRRSAALLLPLLVIGLGGGIAIMASIIATPFVFVGFSFVEGILFGQQQYAQRRIFREEQRRIADMAELAGGLTLAESMGDEALVGALSPDGAQGGELERAGEGV